MNFLFCTRSFFYNFTLLNYKIINYILFSLRDVEYSNFPQISGVVKIKGSGKIILGRNVKITSNINVNPIGLTTRTIICVTYGKKLEIGNNVGISNSLIFVMNGIKIEDDVMIGGGCQIFDTDFHSLNYEDRIKNGDCNIKTYPVLIKKGVFVGTQSIILKGVTIGENSVVAAGSVVTKSIPSNEIWGGNPAKFIKII